MKPSDQQRIMRLQEQIEKCDRHYDEPGKYSVYIHDNEFESNDLFLNGSPEVNMNVRIENNTFTLLKAPHAVERESRFRGVGEPLVDITRNGKNKFQ